ncbi:MAG TPA: winged helix-turn-helix domain-containing protein [Terracidiphilus sp.]|jgi:DNA-binding winged helix-turn-helix (wHTH) protein/tetratricopeptide (TPR) repeat protein|nr:winged helix-turn-helix domain-containing protein [Terracidiphilus sp.]
MVESTDRKSPQLYEFGPFRVDPEKELLLRENETVPIAPKTFQVLLVLMRHSKQVVTKDDLLKTVWPDTFVEEANLSRNIFLLRKALGESPQDHQYIVTVPGRGYRFAEDVQVVSDRTLDMVAASHSKVHIEITETQPWRWIALAAVFVAVVAAGALKYFSHRGPVPNDKDALVLADFTNSTGDPVFDGTLRQGLAIQLDQSPFLKILDDAKLQRDLELMNVPPGSRVTHQIAHDVCIREGSAAIIDGAIASLGKSYVLTLQAVSCQDGKTLAREQIQAEKEQVLQALSSAATQIRSKLGESLNSIQKSNQPLEQATTSSLDALKDYTTGLAIMGQGHFLASAPLFERAIAIDPKFAMAYFVLAVVYEQAGDMDSSAKYAKKAFDLLDHTSESERAEITAYYYRATGELNKEIDAYQLAIRNNYPRQWSFHNQLSVTYIDLGQFEKGLEEAREANQLNPDIEAPYRRILDAYLCTDHLAEADQTAAKVRARGIDGSRIHQRFLELGFIEDDKAAIAREIQWFAGKPEEYISFGLQAANLNLHGKRQASHAMYQRAADLAQREGFRYVAEEFQDADARADALSGNCVSAQKLGHPAFALALCGQTSQAATLAAQSSKALPNGTIWNAVQLPEIQSLLALNRNDPATAIELMTAASPYERAYPDAIYVRGLAYLKMHKGAEAAAEFQKIEDHKGASWAATWVHPNWALYYSLSYLGMARGLAMAGENRNAKKAYGDFLASWNQADRDTPILKQAKAEYARLK